MWVLTPQQAWALTQSCPERIVYFSSNHFTNLEQKKPVLSGANVVSTDRNGRLLWTIRFLRTGVRIGFSRYQCPRWDQPKIQGMGRLVGSGK